MMLASCWFGKPCPCCNEHIGSRRAGRLFCFATIFPAWEKWWILNLSISRGLDAGEEPKIVFFWFFVIGKHQKSLVLVLNAAGLLHLCAFYAII